MDVFITGHRAARAFRPEGKAYAIRIFGKAPIKYADLKGKYVHVGVYRFDETSLIQQGWEGIPFSEDIARAIIRDFSGSVDKCSQLLVHCFSGAARGPAVARALYERFNLEGGVYTLVQTSLPGEGTRVARNPLPRDGTGRPDWDKAFEKLDGRVYDTLLNVSI